MNTSIPDLTFKQLAKKMGFDMYPVEIPESIPGLPNIALFGDALGFSFGVAGICKRGHGVVTSIEFLQIYLDSRVVLYDGMNFNSPILWQYTGDADASRRYVHLELIFLNGLTVSCRNTCVLVTYE